MMTHRPLSISCAMPTAVCQGTALELQWQRPGPGFRRFPGLSLRTTRQQSSDLLLLNLELLTFPPFKT